MSFGLCSIFGKTGIAKATAFALMLAIATSASAMGTLGDRSCGTWGTEKADPTMRMGDTAWLMGFMTGNALGSGYDIVNGVDGNALMVWVDNYCQAHPLYNASNAAMALVTELRARMPKR